MPQQPSRFAALVTSAALMCGFGTPVAVAAGGRDAAVARAQALVDGLAAGRFDEVAATFDATMASALPAQKLRDVWAQLTGSAGSFQGRNGARTETLQGYTVVFVRCRFARAPLDAKVVYDGAGRVSGLFFVPPAAATPEADGPPYADRARFTEREVTVDAGGWPLPGTLTLPVGDGPFPGLVLVHGSGPNDRDESLGPNKPFRDLAWGLASRGVVVLRYEKRTRQHQGRCAAALATLTVKEETVEDAVAAAALLRSTPGVAPKRVFVLGHSLGGYLAPRVALADPALAGLIIMAGPARSLHLLMVEQVDYLAGLDPAGAASPEGSARLKAFKDQAKQVEALTSEQTGAAEPVLVGAGPSYWLDLRGYEPAATAAALPPAVRLLLILGRRDYQVTLEDWKRWGAALKGRPGVTAKAYPALNHLFIAGEGRCTPAEYERPGHVDPAVIEDLAAWLVER